MLSTLSAANSILVKLCNRPVDVELEVVGKYDDDDEEEEEEEEEDGELVVVETETETAPELCVL